jgi:hypothetical protein
MLFFAHLRPHIKSFPEISLAQQVNCHLQHPPIQRGLNLRASHSLYLRGPALATITPERRNVQQLA